MADNTNYPNYPNTPEAKAADAKNKADTEARARAAKTQPYPTQAQADADARARDSRRSGEQPGVPHTTVSTPNGPVPAPYHTGDATRTSATGVPASPAPVAKGPFNLTTDDVFLLKDLNHDGIMDTIVIERVDKAAEAKAKADAEHYTAYHKTIADAKQAATNANVGKPAIEITAAENVAIAKAKADFKGAVPSPTKEDLAKTEADRVAADHKVAFDAEVRKLKAQS